MSISKRLRFQILRRDNYTCRYCGAFAPVAVLVVDHVVPRKLGGRDVAENLVTACEPCNNGKAAASPEEWLVEEVAQSGRTWEDDGGEGDDSFAVALYQRAMNELEALSADEVLHYIAVAHAIALPYRPTHSESVRMAGTLAAEARRGAGAGA